MLGYPTMSAVDAAALVRAARQYQEALWIAEVDARQAWLRFISAVEAARGRWSPGRDRVTLRFINFVTTFLPRPPPSRPRDRRVDWRHMATHMESIYNLRSRASHGGSPFPASICEPVYRFGRELAPEIPDLQESQASAEAPMMLHMFEYIARHVLQNWWRSAVRAASGNGW